MIHAADKTSKVIIYNTTDIDYTETLVLVFKKGDAGSKEPIGSIKLKLDNPGRTVYTLIYGHHTNHSENKYDFSVAEVDILLQNLEKWLDTASIPTHKNIAIVLPCGEIGLNGNMVAQNSKYSQVISDIKQALEKSKRTFMVYSVNITQNKTK
jgi:hypothetical protein